MTQKPRFHPADPLSVGATLFGRLNAKMFEAPTLATNDSFLRATLLPLAQQSPGGMPEGDIRIVRRDRHISMMTFALFCDGALVQKLSLNHEGTVRHLWREGDAWVTNSRGVFSHHGLYDDLDPAAAAAATLPNVFAFVRPRVADSLLQAAALASAHHRAGRTSVPVYTPPTRTIFDPFWAHEQLGVTTERVARTDRCHVVMGRAGLANHGQINRALRTIFGRRDRARALSFAPKTRGPLYVSFDVEKMRWLNAVDVIDAFLQTLAENDERVSAVIVNGMTAPFDGAPPDFFDEVRAQEAVLIADLARRQPALSIMHLFGQTMRQKVEAVRAASFFITPAGSADYLPGGLKIPGVIVGNPIRLAMPREISNRNAVDVPHDLIAMEERPTGAMLHAWTERDNWKDYAIDPAPFARFAFNHYRTHVMMPAAAQDTTP
ncbi:MAG: hypothetical protein AAF318_18690 [Pseudomonadota bacterium]